VNRSARQLFIDRDARREGLIGERGLRIATDLRDRVPHFVEGVASLRSARNRMQLGATRGDASRTWVRALRIVIVTRSNPTACRVTVGGLLRASPKSESDASTQRDHREDQ